MIGRHLPALQSLVQIVNECITTHRSKVPTGYTIEQINVRLPDGSAVTLFWAEDTKDWQITTSG